MAWDTSGEGTAWRKSVSLSGRVCGSEARRVVGMVAFVVPLVTICKIVYSIDFNIIPLLQPLSPSLE